jgi:hypothetical protein
MDVGHSDTGRKRRSGNRRLRSQRIVAKREVVTPTFAHTSCLVVSVDRSGQGLHLPVSSPTMRTGLLIVARR